MEYAGGLVLLVGVGGAGVATVQWAEPLVRAALARAEQIPDSADAPPDAPEVLHNVLVIVVDDLGVDQLRLYGAADAPITPALDKLARGGMTFQNAYAATETHGALLTGRTAADFAADEVTLAEMLSAGGHPYASSAVGRWGVSSNPLRQGFGWFAGAIGAPSGSIDELPIGHHLWVKTPEDGIAIAEVYASTSTGADAVERLEEMPEPWLLWVGFAAPPAFPESLVTMLDAEIGRVVAAVGPERAARTTVVFTGARTSNPGGQVPLIVSGPLVATPGAYSDAEVRAVDLFPTLAEIARVDVEGLQIDGLSFTEVLANPGARIRVASEPTEPEPVAPVPARPVPVQPEHVEPVPSEPEPEPVTEVPATEEPATEEPATEEPATEQPVVEPAPDPDPS